jgi:hypothetical protein
MKKFLFMGLVVASVATFVGCEGGGDSNSGPYGNGSNSSSSSTSSSPSDSQNQFYGTWELTEVGTSNVWYIHFGNNGNWKITDDKAGAEQRVYGSYNYSGNQFEGPMINPNVGEGKIGGDVTDGVMTLHFKEYWHIPHKIVDYTGTKVN